MVFKFYSFIHITNSSYFMNSDGKLYLTSIRI